MGFRVLGYRVSYSGLGFGVKFRVWGFWGFGFQVMGLGFRGLGASGLDVRFVCKGWV